MCAEVKTTMPARVTEVKCKRCRKVLFTEEATPLLTAHSEVRTGPTHSRCGSGAPEYCLYISEESVPEWIKDAIDKEFWIKGKIHCPHCHSRLGSFDFVNQTKCDCGDCLPPPIRIIHCKVDRLSDTGSNLPFLPLPRIPYNPHPRDNNDVQLIQLVASNRRGHVLDIENLAENNIANNHP
ncbi:E3 ubiquitin-protein ligase RNF180-like [Diprion similis]|uniref:E3 ubiquitin-protein ligase RNF180-like n=1 Tax=Diprion similis TaxID=362088 RepID=UPI001EF7F81A|nr:E3 ubiquitin-protein ligase RNF180-like [Diprion similis]